MLDGEGEEKVEMKNVVGVPDLKVYDWNARSDESSPVSTEYIITENAEDVLLSTVWPVMNKLQKHQLVMNSICYENLLPEYWFKRIGSLYFAADHVDS